MTGGTKGVIAGISATVTTALALVISVAGGFEPHSPILLGPGAMEAGWTTLLFGLPVATLFGGLAGSMVIDVPPLARTALFILLALLALGLCLPFWPGLGPFAVPITIVHAMALARWTAPKPQLPIAIVRRTR